jgi:arylsulfatase A-like enzyme
MFRLWMSLLVIASGSGMAQANRPPNIVLLLADDLGYGDIGCYGCPDIQTPAIDRLASQGIRFTQFYANGPECSPTRTALMTGRYQHRVGGLECAIGTSNVGRYDDAIRLRETHDLGLPVEETTIVAMLKRVGYRAACFGKWHLGYERKFSPIAHGFDVYFGPIGGGVDYFHHTEWDGTPVLYLDDERITREGYMTDLIADEAERFLKEQSGEQPFFLYVPFTAPHTPYQGPDDRTVKPITQVDWNEGTRANYVAMVAAMDRAIGRVLVTLERKRLADNTLVIFASDNGGTRIGRNAPFSGYKSGLMEGGIRVPCIVRWPGRIQPDTVSDIPSLTMDLSVSMVRVAGARPPEGRTFDGVDLLERVTTEAGPPDRALFWRQRRAELTWRAVRDGDYKYISRSDGARREEMLFNLAADPGEHHNVVATRTTVADRMRELLGRWEQDVKPRR